MCLRKYPFSYLSENSCDRKTVLVGEGWWFLNASQGVNKSETKSALQSDHNRDTECMKRICKSQKVISSQIIGVKWWWKNTTVFSSNHMKRIPLLEG